MKDKEYYSFIWEIPTWGGFPVGLPKQYAKKLSVFHRLNKYVEADPDTGLDQYEVDGYYTNTEVDEILNVVIDYLKEQIKIQKRKIFCYCPYCTTLENLIYMQAYFLEY